jgi:hypothetical protein
VGAEVKGMKKNFDVAGSKLEEEKRKMQDQAMLEGNQLKEKLIEMKDRLKTLIETKSTIVDYVMAEACKEKKLLEEERIECQAKKSDLNRRLELLEEDREDFEDLELFSEDFKDVRELWDMVEKFTADQARWEGSTLSELESPEDIKNDVSKGYFRKANKLMEGFKNNGNQPTLENVSKLILEKIV